MTLRNTSRERSGATLHCANKNMDEPTKQKLQKLTVAALREAKMDMIAERERFKKEIFNELLEFHFESRLGKNPNNGLPWWVMLDEEAQPHTDILCSFSQWLLDRGWSKEAVDDGFFIVVDGDED